MMKKDSKAKICPSAVLFNLLSKRHMLMIVYTLTKEELGFNSLQANLNINTATLTARLKELEKEKLVQKKVCNRDSRQHYYSLTLRGKKISKLIGQFSKI